MSCYEAMSDPDTDSHSSKPSLHKWVFSAWVLTLLVFAWLYRWEFAPTQDREGNLYTLDRWTGTTRLLLENTYMDAVEQENPDKEPFWSSDKPAK